MPGCSEPMDLDIHQVDLQVTFRLAIFTVLAPHPPTARPKTPDTYMILDVVCVGIALFCSSAPQLYVSVRMVRISSRFANFGGHKRRRYAPKHSY